MFRRNKQVGWFGKQLEENIKALRDGDRSRISWILCVFSENHDQSKLMAAKVLRETLDSLSFDDIVRVDEQIRQTTSMEKSLTAINRWLFGFNRSFALPHEQQSEVIKELIYGLSEKLPSDIQKELLFALPN